MKGRILTISLWIVIWSTPSWACGWVLMQPPLEQRTSINIDEARRPPGKEFFAQQREQKQAKDRDFPEFWYHKKAFDSAQECESYMEGLVMEWVGALNKYREKQIDEKTYESRRLLFIARGVEGQCFSESYLIERRKMK